MTEYYPFYAHIWYGLRILHSGDMVESTLSRRGVARPKFFSCHCYQTIDKRFLDKLSNNAIFILIKFRLLYNSSGIQTFNFKFFIPNTGQVH